jgi:hypothetical protein
MASATRPPQRIIRDVSANAIQRFLVVNDALIIATLPQDAGLPARFIDVAGRTDRLLAGYI